MNGINTIAVKNSKMIEDMLVRISSVCLYVVVFFILLCCTDPLDTRERDKERRCDEQENEQINAWKFASILSYPMRQT